MEGKTEASYLTNDQSQHGQPPPYDSQQQQYGYSPQLYPPGGHSNMGYAGNPGVYGQHGNVVVTGPVTSSGYVIQPVTYVVRPPNYLILSCVIFWFVNFLFGAVAMCFSFSSQSAADRGDMESARRQGDLAKKMSLFGVAFTVCFIIVYVIVVFAVIQN